MTLLYLNVAVLARVANGFADCKQAPGCTIEAIDFNSPASLAAVPIAQNEGGGMQRDYWYSVARTLKKLDAPEKVGKIAAERTLRRLGARRHQHRLPTRR